QQTGKENEKLLIDARKQYESGKYAEAAATSREGLKRMPNSVAFQQLLQQSEQAAQKAALEETRKQELAKRQAEAAAAQKKQTELGREGHTPPPQGRGGGQVQGRRGSTCPGAGKAPRLRHPCRSGPRGHAEGQPHPGRQPAAKCGSATTHRQRRPRPG